MSLVIFLLILIGLVIAHELGHFFAAKIFGIHVEEFGVGFSPKLLGIERKGTLYTLNALPLGGFVRLLGETSRENGTEAALSSRMFSRKSAPVQAAVIIAGILCNLLVAWALLSVGYMVGLPSSPQDATFGTVQNVRTTIVGVLSGSPADKVGIMSGDAVLGAQTGRSKLDGNASASALKNFIQDHPNESIVLSVLRNGTEMTFLARPADGIDPDHKVLGIQLEDIGMLKLSPPLAVLQGSVLFWQMTKGTAQGLSSFLVSIVRGTANFTQVAGPIGIAGLGASVVKQGLAPVLLLTSLISINLALINIIPIPGLDGGRFVLIIVESVRGRPLSEKLTTRLTVAGFALLLILIVIVTYHDIGRILGH